MIKFKSKLALLAVPAVLAFAAVSYGSVVAFSTATPTPAPAQSEAAEPAEAAGDKAEANEPALPGGGSTDAANTNANTQKEGIYYPSPQFDRKRPATCGSLCFCPCRFLIHRRMP